ncbi:hypothetical protein WJX75_007701 [Coccomyxa subellipsoidea]|uniref:Uncharacterized protein n=1 Tax=Coccomyxa subellipsoidea TaxID=248742 RepID=A0ABR2YN86_9CHLO
MYLEEATGVSLGFPLAGGILCAHLSRHHTCEARQTHRIFSESHRLEVKSATWTNKNDDNQGYGKQQGRPKGNPVGGGAYETGQQGYGDQGQGGAGGYNGDQGYGGPKGYRPNDYEGQGGDSGPTGFHPQEGGGSEGYRPGEYGAQGGGFNQQGGGDFGGGMGARGPQEGGRGFDGGE